MFLVQVRDQIEPHDWCVVYVGEDEERARAIERALLAAGVEPDRVELGVGALVREVVGRPADVDPSKGER